MKIDLLRIYLYINTAFFFSGSLFFSSSSFMPCFNIGEVIFSKTEWYVRSSLCSEMFEIYGINNFNVAPESRYVYKVDFADT